MKRYYIFIILLLLVSLTSQHKINSHTHKDQKNSKKNPEMPLGDFDCVHGEMQKKYLDMADKYQKEKQTQKQSQSNQEESHQQIQSENTSNRRHLTAVPYQIPASGNTQPIRIKYYLDDLMAYGADVISNDQRNFLIAQLEAAKSFYEKRLSVVRHVGNLVINPLAGDKCGIHYTVPAAHRSTGVGTDVDFYVYVTAEKNTEVGYLAYASYCQQELITHSALTAGGRPLAAIINYNTNYLEDLDNAAFAQVMDTTLHELCHALAFSPQLMYSFRRLDTGVAWGTDARNMDVSYRGMDGDILKTTNVREWVAKHFGCEQVSDIAATEQILQGMMLENQGEGGSKGAHWERTMVYDELMTASRLGPSKTFSGLTFALLKDTGFYFVDDSNAETLQWGYQQGCNFIRYACTDPTKKYDEFCEVQGTVGCSGGRESKGSCVTTNLNAYFMDNDCGITNPYSNGRCIVADDEANDSSASFTKQTYREFDSRCFESDLGGAGPVKCYEYKCTDTGLEVYLNGVAQAMKCDYEGQEHFNKESLQGTFKCPDPYKFCGQGRNYCPDWCSSQGYCTDGVCNCKEGTGGKNCDFTCPGGQNITTHVVDYNQDPPVCITEATCCGAPPCDKYANQLNRVCEECSTLCATCEKGGADKCLSCVAGYLFLELDASTSEGKCIKTCPENYWNNGGTCTPCDKSTGLKCKTCNSATGCSSCYEDQYLDHQDNTDTLRLCVTNKASCHGSAAIFDDELKHCYITGHLCQENKINNGGQCEKCPVGQFMTGSGAGKNCVTTCTGNTYADVPLQQCVQCHAECATCFGAFSHNCKTCSNPAHYIFSGRCFTDKTQCPKGSYGNSSNKQCEACNEACLQCSDSNSNDNCSECQVGYFLEGQTCVAEADCPIKKFGNKVDRICQDCHSSCQKCRKEREIDCLECVGGSLLPYLVIEGKDQTCKEKCPSGYVGDANNVCKKCHFTCSTCTGLQGTDCETCKPGYQYHSEVVQTDTGPVTIQVCLFKCPDGFYGYPEEITLTNGTVSNRQTCTNCHSTCKRCFGDQQNNCNLCYEDGTLPYLDLGICVAACPEAKPVDEFSGECYSTILSLSSIFAILVLSLLI